MKTLLYTFAFLFTIQLSAQDPILQKDNERIEDIAIKITDKYDEQIELDAKQTIIFQKKVEEFLIREKKIKETYKGREMLGMITKLRKAETLEMQNILTQIQMDLYKKLKPKIQPLAYADKDKM